MNDQATKPKPNSTDVAAMRGQQVAPREASMPVVRAGFFDLQSFELIQRVSKAFSQSDLVPKNYQGNLANCMIAMDMAQRIGANPLMVMQNLYIVHGTPGWSSKFLIATINASGRYSSLRYEWKGEPGATDFGCRAWAVERETGERLNGIYVTWAMVRAEGWDSKNGSKWKTMPDQMFIYRAAAFWQRAYAPELGMGLMTAEELGDVIDMKQGNDGSFSVDLDSLKTPEAAAAPVNIDTGTGEILTLEQQWAKYDEVLATYGEKEAENFMPKEPRPVVAGSVGAPTFEDAIAAVKADDLDTARDIARGLPEALQQQIETAIANKSKPEGSSTRRPRSGASVE